MNDVGYLLRAHLGRCQLRTTGVVSSHGSQVMRDGIVIRVMMALIPAGAEVLFHNITSRHAKLFRNATQSEGPHHD
jgi:hypothetical protein